MTRFLQMAGLLAATACFALSAPAAAQLGTSRSGMSTSERLENVRAMRALSRFGGCIARTYRNGALAILASEPGSDEEGELFRRYVFGEQTCALYDTTVSLVYMRGVIAEGLLRSGEALPANYRLPAPVLAEVRNLHDAARCYVSGRHDRVQALLATEAGSAEELAAVRALWSEFSDACIPDNFRFRLNASWIRFLLAEAMLRLAPATAPNAGE